jgi:general secretion pathway protein L
VALAPSEQVSVLAVDLPLPTRRRRAAAAPFAVEDRLAEPLANLHVALGPEIAPRRHLVAVVRRAVLEGWSESLAAAGAADAAILPDYLALPRPEDGAWAIAAEHDRAVVHASDGSGFAVAAGALAAAWEAAGRPRVTIYAGDPPAGFPHERGECDPAATAVAAATFNLRGGGQGTEASSIAAGGRALLAILAVGVVAHLGIAGAETAALYAQVDARRADAAALLADIAPGAPPGGDVLATLAAYAPRASSADPAFLALLARASGALAPFKDGLAVRSFTFDGEARTLEIALEAPDLAAVQRIEAALASAGLAPEAGAATMARGAAEARFIVRDVGMGASS